MIKFDDIYMLAICNDKYFNIINQKWRLNKEIIAYQYGYLKKYVRIINNPIVEIKEIGRKYFEFIKENYSTQIEEVYCLNELMLMDLWGVY